MLAIAAGFIGTMLGASCYDVEETPNCYLWDVSFKLKTVAPKYAKCGKTNLCGDEGEVYYLDNATRKLKGYIWSCEYSCDTWNIVLWDEANKVGIIKYSGDENQATVSTEDAFVYGKKAGKACATFAIVDNDGEKIELFAFGRDGSVSRKSQDGCYVKSLTGYACGKLAYVKPGYYAVKTSGGNLCEDPVVEVEEDTFSAKCMSWCDAFCFVNWCEDGEDAPDMLPCGGTWKMKYNKKGSAGKKGSIRGLIPSYAL